MRAVRYLRPDLSPSGVRWTRWELTDPLGLENKHVHAPVFCSEMQVETWMEPRVSGLRIGSKLVG